MQLIKEAKYPKNIDILLDHNHKSYRDPLPENLVKRSSFSLDRENFLGVQFFWTPCIYKR